MALTTLYSSSHCFFHSRFASLDFCYFHIFLPCYVPSYTKMLSIMLALSHYFLPHTINSLIHQPHCDSNLSLTFLLSYSLQSFPVHHDIAFIHLNTPQKNSTAFKLITISKLHSIIGLKQSFSLGIWPILHILRLSTTTLDYSLKTLVDFGLLSPSDYSPISPKRL